MRIAPILCVSILIAARAVNAQSLLWNNSIAGVSLDITSGAPPSGGVKGVVSYTPPDVRRAGVMWADNNDTLWMFGGVRTTHGDDYYGDTWSLYLNSMGSLWIHHDFESVAITNTLIVIAMAPSARAFMSSWTDGSGTLFMFGGLATNNSELVFFNDLWTFSNGTWRIMLHSLNPEYYGPSARAGAQTWIDQFGNLWLFGGQSSDRMETDTWYFNQTSHKWTAPGRLPVLLSACRNGITWTDSDNNFWLFGGTTSGINVSDIVASEYSGPPCKGLSTATISYSNPATLVWRSVTGSSTIPGRVGASNWLHQNGLLYLYGGYTIDGFVDELWTFDSGSTTWSQITQSASSKNPGSRYASLCAIDNSNRMWIFGGMSNDTIENSDTWNLQLSIYPTSKPTQTPFTIMPTSLDPTSGPSTFPATTSPPTTVVPSTTTPTTLILTTSAPTTSILQTTSTPTIIPSTRLPTTPPTPSTTAPTALPTTVRTITRQPTTIDPATSSPSTQVSTTSMPTTNIPTTGTPTTVEPSTNAPTSTPMTTNAPSTSQPTTLMMTTMQATTDRPTTVIPSTNQPTTIAPSTNGPLTVAPTTNGPSTVAPSTNGPSTSLPTTNLATTNAPTAFVPVTNLSTTNNAPLGFGILCPNFNCADVTSVVNGSIVMSSTNMRLVQSNITIFGDLFLGSNLSLNETSLSVSRDFFVLNNDTFLSMSVVVSPRSSAKPAPLFINGTASLQGRFIVRLSISELPLLALDYVIELISYKNVSQNFSAIELEVDHSTSSCLKSSAKPIQSSTGISALVSLSNACEKSNSRFPNWAYAIIAVVVVFCVVTGIALYIRHQRIQRMSNRMNLIKLKPILKRHSV